MMSIKSKSKKKTNSKKNKRLFVRVGGKLPKSKFKLAYLAVLLLFVSTVVGFTGYQYYEYRSILRSVNAYADSGGGGGGRGYRTFRDDWGMVTLQVCKRDFYDSKYGRIIPIVATAWRPTNGRVGQVVINGYRRNPYSGVYDGSAGGRASQSWMFGAILRIDLPLSYLLNDRFDVRAYEPGNAYTGPWSQVLATPQMGFGDVPFCPYGV